MPTFTGTSGDDFIAGGADSDILIGGAGADQLEGQGGDDILYAGAVSAAWSVPRGLAPYEAPTLDTGAERDILNGGAGLDTIFAGYGDVVDGGLDNANLLISLRGASSGVTVDFRSLETSNSLIINGGTITNIRLVLWIEGSDWNDTIVGSDRISGSSTFAPIFGLGGDDRITAGRNTGNIYGGDGDDTIESSWTIGTIFGGAGNDTITAQVTNVSSTISGGDGADIITANGSLSGDEGNDTINLSLFGTAMGGAGDDILRAPLMNGGTLVGGAGSDVLNGWLNNDRLFSAGVTGSEDATAEMDTGSERDELFGGDGNDFLSAGFGDSVDGGNGLNSLALSLVGATSGVILNTSAITGGTVTVGGGTIRSVQVLTHLWGTNFNDRLTIGGSGTLVFGMGGDDTITGGNNNDVIDGGEGNDTLYGGAGANTLTGGLGDDRFYVDSSTDEVVELAGGGEDVVLTTVNFSLLPDSYVEEVFIVGTGNINVTGNAFANRLNGNLEANTLYGDGGDDTLLSGGGDDVLIGGAGRDFLSGGDGNDVLASGDYRTGTIVIEDDLGSERETLSAGEGNDLVYGGYGDTLIGDGGTDTLRLSLAGAASGVTLDIASIVNGEFFAFGGGHISQFEALSYLRGSSFDDQLTLTTQTAPIQVDAGAGNDVVQAGNSDAYMQGGEGSDRLYGGTANDVLLGGAGGDVMVGGAGNDIYEVDNVGDALLEQASQGTDQVFAYIDFTLIDNFETLDMSYGRQVYGFGNELANNIVGNASSNVLAGFDGNDRIDGGAGNDSIDGGSGNDGLIGGTGADTLSGGAGDDFYELDNGGDQVFEAAGNGQDLVYAYVDFTLGANVENLVMVYGNQRFGTGNGGNNIIIGNARQNVIEGGAGYDTLTGGAGSDLFVVRAGFGVDVITDFRAGTGSEDAVLFSTTLFSSYAQVMANARQVGADTWIDGGQGNTLVLTGVSVSALRADDFGFI